MPKKQYGDTEWINGAKFIAILAVMVDHTNGVLYTNSQISWASYFSVTVFFIRNNVFLFM